MKTLLTIIVLLFSLIVLSQGSSNGNQPVFKKSFTDVPSQFHNKKANTHSRQDNNKEQHSYKSALQTKKAEEMISYGINTNTPDAIYRSLNNHNYLLASNKAIPTKSYSSVKMVSSIVNEVNSTESRINYSFPSHRNKAGYFHFVNAYNEIVSMQEGKEPLSLKRAVFLTENAFFSNKLSYSDFDKSIKEMASLINAKMLQSNLSLNNNRNINYMVFKYMIDTLRINILGEEKNVTTYPKTYDFDDPFGSRDVTKLFVSKLILENTGQCKSLPLLYLILVEELGGKAYLSFSPSHSYIKYKEGNTIYNIELTNGMLTTDSWVVASGYVKSETVKSGIYLDTLNTKQVVANCLIDLAIYYGWRYYGYDDFVLKCTNKVLDYHASNILAIQMKADYYSLLFQEVAKQKGYSNNNPIRNDPEALMLFIQRNKLYALLDGLGFENMPEKAYEDWLASLKEKAEQQKHELRIKQFSQPIKN